MYVANHESPRGLVEKLWNGIVQQEQRHMRNKDFKAIAMNLGKKVEHVVKQTSLSSKVFPLEMVVQLLEDVSVSLKNHEGFEGKWVAKLMLDVGVSFNTLFNVYYNLFTASNDKQRQKHLSKPILFILEQWLTSESSQTQKRLSFFVDEIILRLEESALPECQDFKNLKAKMTK